MPVISEFARSGGGGTGAVAGRRSLGSEAMGSDVVGGGLEAGEERRRCVRRQMGVELRRRGLRV